MSVLNTSENASGLWRTPSTPTGGTVSDEGLEAIVNGEKRPSGHVRQITLQDQVRHSGLWPTPRANNENNSLNDKVNNAEGKTGQLNADWVEALMLWPVGWTSMESLKELDWDFDGSRWEPDIPRVTSGQKDRAHRLKSIGNGQVSLCMAVAWLLLSEV
jgi:hypothetical protein